MGCGRMLSPLFKDRTFEYIPIPEGTGKPGITYEKMIGARTGKALLRFFPVRRRNVMRAVTAHNDPEFDTFTYGDPTTPKRRLQELRRGDFLVFYAGLEPYDFTDSTKRGLYIIGYFEVEAAGSIASFGQTRLQTLFDNNYHIQYRTPDRRLVLVKGSQNSRLLHKAQIISRTSKDRKGHKLYVLSEEATAHMGKFTEQNAIQRSPPRWVSIEKTRGAAEWVRSLT
jgi:hypothetical protein